METLQEKKLSLQKTVSFPCMNKCLKLKRTKCFSPRQVAVLWLPFPVTVVKIKPTIFDTRKLPVDVWTTSICVQRLDRTVEHPLPMSNIALFRVKLELVIDFGVF